MITLFLAAAAALVAFTPWVSATLPPAGMGLRLPAPKPPRHAGYAEAIAALSVVRGRLAATESLSDKERAAVDALTLALVNGSDHE